MHFHAVVVATFTALAMSVGPAFATPLAAPEAVPEAIPELLESRAQCSGGVHKVGAGCSKLGHTSCSADKKAVVGDFRPSIEQILDFRKTACI